MRDEFLATAGAAGAGALRRKNAADLFAMFMQRNMAAVGLMLALFVFMIGYSISIVSEQMGHHFHFRLHARRKKMLSVDNSDDDAGLRPIGTMWRDFCS